MILSAVTPLEVAPPLSPVKVGRHGGMTRAMPPWRPSSGRHPAPGGGSILGLPPPAAIAPGGGAAGWVATCSLLGRDPPDGAATAGAAPDWLGSAVPAVAPASRSGAG